MPTYEYKCSACGHEFEQFQSMTAKPLRKCPECGGSVKRLPGTGGLILFKGSGFYETDYKRKPTQPSTKTDSPSPSSTSSPSSASSSPTPPSDGKK